MQANKSTEPTNLVTMYRRILVLIFGLGMLMPMTSCRSKTATRAIGSLIAAISKIFYKTEQQEKINAMKGQSTTW